MRVDHGMHDSYYSARMRIILRRWPAQVYNLCTTFVCVGKGRQHHMSQLHNHKLRGDIAPTQGMAHNIKIINAL